MEQNYKSKMCEVCGVRLNPMRAHRLSRFGLKIQCSKCANDRLEQTLTFPVGARVGIHG